MEASLQADDGEEEELRRIREANRRQRAEVEEAPWAFLRRFPCMFKVCVCVFLLCVCFSFLFFFFLPVLVWCSMVFGGVYASSRLFWLVLGWRWLVFRRSKGCRSCHGRCTVGFCRAPPQVALNPVYRSQVPCRGAAGEAEGA